MGDIIEPPETEEELATRLAWYHVIAICESVTPLDVFRPAQAYCWKQKPANYPPSDLSAIILTFRDDLSFREWVQRAANPIQVFALWEAISALSRRFYLLDDDEKPDPLIVAEVRANPSARAVFAMAIRLWQRPTTSWPRGKANHDED